MSKFIPNATMDTLLEDIATCTRLDVVSDTTTPTDLTNTLANVTLTAGDGNGDFDISDGDVSGRKITISAQEGITITGAGTAKHIVLSLDGTIKYITTCTDQVLVLGIPLNTPAFKHEIEDPT